MKVVVTLAILVASVLGTLWITGLEPLFQLMPPVWHPKSLDAMHHKHDQPGLATSALAKVLRDASPIFGVYSNEQTEASTWMSRYPDATKLVHMNIPGVHDAATWNYSTATQQSLKHVTRLISDSDVDPSWFRCQDRSIVDMLNAGIRAFDLRYAQDVTRSTLVFWHGPALQSQTATVEDVLFGFYQWLEDHPSEVLFLSFQYEANAAMGNVDDEFVQRKVYDILTSSAAQTYLVQNRDALGTIGSARGKAILFRRFDLDLLPAEYEETIPGIRFSPKRWEDNTADIKLTYKTSNTDVGEEGVAYIEDYYQPRTLPSSTLADNIDVKFDAIKSHLLQAASDSHPDGLFWTFTSGTKVRNEPEAVTPRKMALGNDHGAVESAQDGVNQRLKALLGNMKDKRLGIVMLDFFEEPSDLLHLTLGLRQP